MRSKEALENIKDNYPLVHPTNYKLIRESFDTLEQLVYRDTPMKVDLETKYAWNIFYHTYDCPNCGQTAIGRYYNYCPKCGQRLELENEV